MEVWNGIWKKNLVWNEIWKGRFLLGMEMEWKKIAAMEYGKILFHSIPHTDNNSRIENKIASIKNLRAN